MKERETAVGRIVPEKIPQGQAKNDAPKVAPASLAALLGGRKPGLFDAMNAPLEGLTPDDISYAGEVDAALAARP